MGYSDPEVKKKYQADYYQKNRERIRKKQNPNSSRYFKNNREKVREYRLLKQYNIPLSKYNQILAEQGGGCAICKTKVPGKGILFFSVDHDHTCCAGKRSCGKCIRGLLCSTCNSGIGYLKDDSQLLRAAITYLETPLRTSKE